MNWNVSRRVQRLFSFPEPPGSRLLGTFSDSVTFEVEVVGVFCLTLDLNEEAPGIQGNDPSRAGGAFSDCNRDFVSFLRGRASNSGDEVPCDFKSVVECEAA